MDHSRYPSERDSVARCCVARSQRLPGPTFVRDKVAMTFADTVERENPAAFDLRGAARHSWVVRPARAEAAP